MVSDLIKKLMHFGFTTNEAKAYIALLDKQPATGYEISQMSGVARSAIYDILRKLEMKGIVSTDGGKPSYYSPVNPDELTLNLTSRFEHNLQELKNEMSNLNREKTGEKFWNITGYQAMIEQARSMIDHAEKSVFCSIWEREFSEIKMQLENAEQRGVKLINFSFTQLMNPIGEVITYAMDEHKLREIWHRQLVIIVDRKTVLLGGADKNVKNRSIFTDNPAILNIALNYLVLDITLFSDRKKQNLESVLKEMMTEKSESLQDLL